MCPPPTLFRVKCKYAINSSTFCKSFYPPEYKNLFAFIAEQVINTATLQKALFILFLESFINMDQDSSSQAQPTLHFWLTIFVCNDIHLYREKLNMKIFETGESLKVSRYLALFATESG